MKGILNTAISLFLLTFFSIDNSYAQEHDKTPKLNLQNKGNNIENIIEISVSPTEHRRIQEITGNKITIRKPEAFFNGKRIAVTDLNTRGKTTLHYRRKSFSISLSEKATFSRGDQTIEMKKFKVNCLSMDQYYFRNRLAFELMEILNIFKLFYAYTELKINGNSEGIHLIVERPQDFALKQKDSPLVIRRGYYHNIENIKTGKKIDKPEAKNYKSYYNLIYKSLNRYKGKKLYDTLSQWIDLEMYMKWLAFNLFVRNGDYTDEVYFYISPDEDRFKIIPWDYDDIFASSPHEGIVQKRKNIGSKLIFSSEDKLDLKIANDPYLYNAYLQQLEKVIKALTPSVLKKSVENVYAELCPFYIKPEIMQNVQHDAFKDANFKTLHESMTNIYNLLVNSRGYFLQALDNEVSN